MDFKVSTCASRAEDLTPSNLRWNFGLHNSKVLSEESELGKFRGTIQVADYASTLSSFTAHLGIITAFFLELYHIWATKSLMRFEI